MITAIVMISVESDKIPEVAEQIAGLDGISEVYSVAGDVDLIAIVRVTEFDDIADTIAFAVTAIGAGRYSLDHVFSLHFGSLGWALAALAACLLATILTLALARFEAHHHSPRGSATAA